MNNYLTTCLNRRQVHHKGEVRMHDLVAMLPMVDETATHEMLGSDVLMALENGVSQYPKLEGRFPQARCQAVSPFVLVLWVLLALTSKVGQYPKLGGPVIATSLPSCLALHIKSVFCWAATCRWGPIMPQP